MKRLVTNVPLWEQGGIPMTYYRLYFLDGGNGAIVDFREFDADNDVAAVAAAGQLRGMGAMELWSMGRKVRSWGPVAAAPARRPPPRYLDAGSSRLASP
jgi:hypothetical protein